MSSGPPAEASAPRTGRADVAAFRGWPAVVGALIAPAALIATYLWLIWTHTGKSLFYDEWDLVPLVRHLMAGTLRFGDLWSFHNEHRIVLPRALQVILIDWTGWNRQILMTFNLAVAVGTLSLILWCIWRTIRSTTLLLALSPPITLLLLAFSQYQNFLWPFQLTFFLTVFGVALCMVGLTFPPNTNWGFAIALIGAIVASISSLAGLMAWIAFFPIVWLVGYRRILPLGIWILTSLAIGIPYFQGFPRVGTNLASPVTLLAYGLAYIGAPIGDPSPIASQIAGAVGLGLMLGGLAILRHNLRTYGIWLGLALFSLACAALTTIGRASIGGELPSRYQAFSALFWVTCAVVIGSHLRQFRAYTHAPVGSAAHPQPIPPYPIPMPRRLWLGFMCLNIVATPYLVIGLLHANESGFHVARDGWLDLQRQYERQCLLAYESAPDECLTLYYASATIVRERAAYLNGAGLGLFANTDFPQLVASGTVPPRYYIDSINGTSVVAGAPERIRIPRAQPLIVTGWAIDVSAQSLAGGVLVALDGETPTRAFYEIDRLDVAQALGDARYRYAGFRAVIPASRLTAGEHTVTFWLITADGERYFRLDQVVIIEVA